MGYDQRLTTFWSVPSLASGVAGIARFDQVTFAGQVEFLGLFDSLLSALHDLSFSLSSKPFIIYFFLNRLSFFFTYVTNQFLNKPQIALQVEDPLFFLKCKGLSWNPLPQAKDLAWLF